MQQNINICSMNSDSPNPSILSRNSITYIGIDIRKIISKEGERENEIRFSSLVQLETLSIFHFVSISRQLILLKAVKNS